MLFFSDFLFSQVRIKEKVVINPQQSLKNNNIIGGDTTSASQVLDTTGTIVTVKYYYTPYDMWGTGFGIVRTKLSPCDAYKDSAIGNTVNFMQQGLAQFHFTAYDSSSNGYIFQGFPQYSLVSSGDSIVVTDNRGVHKKELGLSPFVQYWPQSPVGCVISNPQPQTLDTNSFEVYKQGDLFLDPNLSQPIVVDNCGYNVSPRTIRFGLTMPLWYVNMDKSTPFHDALQDITDINKDPKICLDNTNPADKRWLFQFKTKVRIPIFSSLCPPSSFTNLGGNPTVWQTTITSCKVYEKADKAMQYWLKGSYASGGASPPYKYYFDSMIMAHEDTHVEDWKVAIQDSMNKAYNDAFTNRPHTSLYSCARSAFNSWPKQGSEIPQAYVDATKDKRKTAQQEFIDELKTDKDARTKARRQIIFDQFKVWGQLKGWVDQNGNVKCP
jgi:hypothetical protein